MDGPRYERIVPLDTTDTMHAGRFAIDLTNLSEVTAPGEGQLYRTYWSLGAHIDVGLGFDVDVGERLVPVAPPPPVAVYPPEPTDQ